MDNQRKKELIEEYRQHKPDMGIIYMRCKSTDETFMDISRDNQRAFNRHLLQLDTHTHPNRRLQELWNLYGTDGFERGVYRIHEYDDPAEDQTDALNALLAVCLGEVPQARSIRPLKR